MDETDKERMMTAIGVSGWIFLLVPAHPGCPRQHPESRKMVVCASVRVCIHAWLCVCDI